jgi:glycosyl transferase family 25
MCVVYINLIEASERRNRMESGFRSLNIAAQRRDAVRWSSLNKSDQDRYYSESINRQCYHLPLVDGEKGCYVSHIEAWRAFLASEFNFMVVLEDDVVIKGAFPAVVDSVTRLAFAWDMVKLVGREEEKIGAAIPLCEGFSLIDYSRVPSYTAGYVVSRGGAEKLLRSRVPFGRPIDVYLRFWWENDLVIYGVLPAALEFDQTSDSSTISGRQKSRSATIALRKLKMKIKMTVLNTFHRARRFRSF